jgi:hypothetical protein
MQTPKIKKILAYEVEGFYKYGEFIDDMSNYKYVKNAPPACN